MEAARRSGFRAQDFMLNSTAAWMLRRDLKKVKAGEEIAIGTATDPINPPSAATW